MEPIYVRDRNEATGDKVGILFRDNGVSNGVVVDLDKYILDGTRDDPSKTTFLRGARKARMILTSGIEGKSPDATV